MSIVCAPALSGEPTLWTTTPGPGVGSGFVPTSDAAAEGSGAPGAVGAVAVSCLGAEADGTDPAPPADAPCLLPPYVAVRKLGHGNFGDVWLALDPAAPEQPVAVKVGRSASAMGRREADVLHSLPPHPHVIGYRGLAVAADGSLQLVLEYAPGGDLCSHVAAAVARGSWTWHNAVSVMQQVAAAVAHAHGQPSPVIHRDIKPENVLVGSDGRMKLADFGLAKHTATTATIAHSIMAGTPLYMAPEVQRSSSYSAAADVWSLGVMLHCLLLGLHGDGVFECFPFVDPAAPSLEKTRANLQCGHVNLSRLPPEAPVLLRGMLAWMLSTTPRERPSAAQVADSLAALAAAAPSAATPALLPAVAPAGSAAGSVAAAIDAALHAKHLTLGRLPSMFDDREYAAVAVPPVPLTLWQQTYALMPTVPAAATGGSAAGGSGVGEVAPSVTRSSSSFLGATVAAVASLADRLVGFLVLSGDAGTGKTCLLRSIAYCHAAKPAADHGGVWAGDFSGYNRVVLLRLRELAGVVRTTWHECSSVGEVAARLVMAMGAYNVTDTPAAALAAELFAPPTEVSTLWLLDAFDEVAGGEGMVDDLAQAAASTHGAGGAAPDSHVVPTLGLSVVGDSALQCACHAVLRLLVTQPHVVVSTRPRFARRLGLVRHVQLEKLNPTAVQAFVAAALADDAAASVALQQRMRHQAALLEAMCTPVLMHMAIEAQRGGGGDAVDGGDVVVGLYQRMEQRFIKQLARQTSAAGADASVAWRACCAAASSVALQGCTSGSAVMAWPADAASQRDMLIGIRLIDRTASGQVEFAHRSWQEWFAARSMVDDLKAGLELSALSVGALKRAENNTLRRFVLALADSPAAANKAVAVLWDAGERDFTAAALQPLAEAVVGSPHASRLSIRPMFAARAEEVCDAVRRSPHPRDPLFDVAAFWVVTDAMTGGEQVAWAVERLRHYSRSLWVGKSPLPALCGLDILAHVQPCSEAVSSCLMSAVGVWNADVRVKATLQLLVSGPVGSISKTVLGRTVADASADQSLRLVAWGRLVQRYSGDPLLADVGSSVLCQRGCPTPLAVEVASNVPATSLAVKALDVCLTLPDLREDVRRGVLAERLAQWYPDSALGACFRTGWSFYPQVAQEACVLPAATQTLRLHNPRASACDYLVPLRAAMEAGQVDAFHQLGTGLLPFCDATLVAQLLSAATCAGLPFVRSVASCIPSVIDPAYSERLFVAVSSAPASSQQRGEALLALAVHGHVVTDGMVLHCLPEGDWSVVASQHHQRPRSMSPGEIRVHASPALSHTTPAPPPDASAVGVGGGEVPTWKRAHALRLVDIGDAAALEAAVRALACPTLHSIDFDNVAGLSASMLSELPATLARIQLRDVGPVPWLDLRRFVALTSLHVPACDAVTDAFVASLPCTLQHLNVSRCAGLTPSVSFARLTALLTLVATGTRIVCQGSVDTLPACLRRLDLRETRGAASGVILSRLASLEVAALHRCGWVSDATVASLPPTIAELDLRDCDLVTHSCSLRSSWRLRSLRLTLHGWSAPQANGCLRPVRNSFQAGSFDCAEPSSWEGLVTSARSVLRCPSGPLLDIDASGTADGSCLLLPAGVESLRLVCRPRLTTFPITGSSLRSLDLRLSSGISDSVVGLLPRTLEELVLDHCMTLTMFVDFTRFERLQKLVLYRARGITAMNIKRLPLGLAELHGFQVNRLLETSDFTPLVSLRAVSAPGMHFPPDVLRTLSPSLQYLDLTGTPSHSGDRVTLTLRHLTSLRCLLLANASTSRGHHLIDSDRLPPCVEHLDLYGIPDIGAKLDQLLGLRFLRYLRIDRDEFNRAAAEVQGQLSARAVVSHDPPATSPSDRSMWP